MQLLEVFLEGKKKERKKEHDSRQPAPLDSSYDRHIPGERV